MGAPFILTDIFIYPIKSLGGIRVDQALIEPRGLQYDRRWMLIDEANRFLTQRVHPKMALLQVQLQPTGLLVTHKQFTTESLFISSDFQTYQTKQILVSIWDDTVPAIEVSTEANAWFSQMLQLKCRLVFMSPHVHRPVDPTYAQNQEPVSFADAFPILLIGQESLNDLNARLPEPVPMNRFRPNLVFSGGTPFLEDTWRNFTIGDQKFNAVKPCSRCVLITINQDTAQKGTEPLRTLATYRTMDQKVKFGQNVLPLSTGEIIKTGDVVTVIAIN